ESRRLESDLRVEPHVLPADFRQRDAAAAAVQRRGGLIDLEGCGVGPLKIVAAVLLDVGDGCGVATHAASGEKSGDAVTRLDAQVPIDAARRRARRQEVQRVD